MSEQAADNRTPRRVIVSVFAAVALATAGCGVTAPSDAASRTPAPTTRAATPEDRQTTPATPAPAEDPPPAPGVALPKAPADLADALTRTTRDLRAAVGEWAGTDDESRPPERVVLLALHQQRIYRHLARNPGTATRTYARLSRPLAKEAKDNVTAARDLLSLVRPLKGGSTLRVRAAEPAGALIRHFKRAERRFGVSWQVLAAVMFVETKFGRVRSPSHTGAKGPMQFMPGTWAAYGMGGDVNDTGDAILAAANYLHASGAPRDYEKALYAYNHSRRYVNAVLLHAGQIKRDVRNYYAYYNWSVFVVTTEGDRRLTGPGR
ncbi:lytic transglycosylase domain-containing protein [Spongiactinospora sp. TRM90649]|uniref:lytic transglycosylase domain-containing protein n=1 Tax=Spongiactinospora sp. TRM90649 TaxID=3031114 RepID=UPI0023F7E71E|nr:lytic transglycosylase domain-containing protein [Spongiactinospora sp. TRM90649]MDF5758229.1 lytic transglycosylase domain-containing protein [Spongiactinospora sp. TRM90649]